MKESRYDVGFSAIGLVWACISLMGCGGSGASQKVIVSKEIRLIKQRHPDARHIQCHYENNGTHSNGFSITVSPSCLWWEDGKLRTGAP